MDYWDIVLALGALLSIGLLYRNKSYQNLVIVCVQIVSVLMMFFDSLFVIGYFVFTVSLLLILIYPISVRNFVRKKLSIIFLIVVPVLLKQLYTLFDYPSFSVLSLVMFVPLVGLVLALIRYESFKKEITFLVLPSIYSLLILFKYFTTLSLV